MKSYFLKLLSEVLGNMYENGQIAAIPAFNFEVPKENFGDFTTNVAHGIAREGKFQANDVADIIARALKEQDKAQGVLAEARVLNGFINIFVAPKALAEYILQSAEEIKIEQFSGKVVFEYSSPNTNKPLHIGHTRNDVFGMACIRLLRASGYEVIATEVINDRGIHIMKSILMYKKYGNGETPQGAGIKADHFVGKYYQMFAAENAKYKEQHPADQEKEPAAEQSPAWQSKAATVLTPLEKEAQALLQKWEAGDSEVRTLWRKMNDWYYQGVKQTYQREASEFDAVEHESEIYDKGRELVLAGLQKGIFHKDLNGAVYVDLTEQGLDKKYLLRQDGTTIYITQDIYLWHLRDEKYHPDQAIVVTANEQIYHFAVLKKIFELLKFPWADNFKHLPYGFVYLGKNKISSRAGNAVSADELVQMTKERVMATMRNSKKIKAAPDDDALVEAIAFAAIKYGYLKFDPKTQIFFDLEETAAIEGNTGPYLQYTYARIQSIFEKAGGFAKADAKNAPMDLNQPTEQSLMRFLMHYPQTVLAAAKEHRPNLICSYLFELAQKFNAFYDQVQVIDAANKKLQSQRLNLLLAVAKVLQHGLDLLGIQAVQKM